MGGCEGKDIGTVKRVERALDIIIILIHALFWRLKECYHIFELRKHTLPYFGGAH